MRFRNVNILMLASLLQSLSILVASVYLLFICVDAYHKICTNHLVIDSRYDPTIPLCLSIVNILICSLSIYLSILRKSYRLSIVLVTAVVLINLFLLP